MLIEAHLDTWIEMIWKPENRINLIALAVFALLSSTLEGCSLRQTIAFDAAEPFIEGAMRQLMAESDLDLAKSAMESDLKLLDGLIDVRPNEEGLLLLAVQGYTGYAMIYLEDQAPERAREMYRRAKEYGFRLLRNRHKGFDSDSLNFNEFATQVANLKRSDLPAVYWTATAWAQLVNLSKTSTDAMAEFPRIKLLMEWVLKIDPDYYYSGARWFFGVYYASLPPLLGGDPVKSSQYFEAAVASSGDKFLWGKVLYAKYYAVNTLDKPLFERLLNEVITGSKTAPADLRLLNSAAAEKAKILLTKSEELF
jgi:hypothetical protein